MIRKAKILGNFMLDLGSGGVVNSIIKFSCYNIVYIGTWWLFAED